MRAPIFALCLLLQVTAGEASENSIPNWFFDFGNGKTVSEVRGKKASETVETLIIERSVGEYRGATFVSQGRVETVAGTLIASGTLRWEKVEDHFEAEIQMGEAIYRGVLNLHASQKAVLEIFAGGRRMNRGEYQLRDGTMHGKTEFFDDRGHVVTTCSSETRKTE